MVAILAVYDIFFGAHKIAGYLAVINGVLTPVVFGCVIAYLLAPIVDLLERTLLRPWAAGGHGGAQARAPGCASSACCSRCFW